jgi:hypothetical protein
LCSGVWAFGVWTYGLWIEQRSGVGSDSEDEDEGGDGEGKQKKKSRWWKVSPIRGSDEIDVKNATHTKVVKDKKTVSRTTKTTRSPTDRQEGDPMKPPQDHKPVQDSPPK